GHDLGVPDTGSWAIILGLGLGTGGFGHFLINWAHAQAPIVLTSLLTLLIPVVAMAGAAAFLGEEIVAAQVVGAAVVLGALAGVVARLAPALEKVTDDATVAGHAAEGLDGNGGAVDELGAADTHQERVEVGDDVHRVAVDVPRLVEAGPARPRQRHRGIGAPLGCG